MRSNQPTRPSTTSSQRHPAVSKDTLVIQRERLGLGLILLAALAHGLLYVFLIPPWQHYDEPNHFEYVWLIANRGELPAPGDIDPTMRSAVASSMQAHGFFAALNLQPPSVNEGKPAWIGSFPQLDEPPLYYLAAAPPVWLSRSAPIEIQLYAARLASLVFLLVTVFIANRAASELTRPGHPLRLLAPLLLALLPGFVDVMTAVNNDVGAVAFFSLYLWGCLRLLQHGFSWRDLLWTGVVAAASLWVKVIALLTLPFFILLLLFLLMRAAPRPGWAWAASLALLSVALVLGLLHSDAAYWYRAASQTASSREGSSQAIHGRYAFQVVPSAGTAPPWMAPFTQPLPQETVLALRGQTVTLGAWLWATAPAQIRTPGLSDGREAFFTQVLVDTSPRFFAFHADLPPDISRLWVALDPAPGADAAGLSLSMDGLVLAAGAWPLDTPPTFTDGDGTQGEWGDALFQNLLRNPSGESAWPRLAASLDNAAARVLPDNMRPSLVLFSLLDPAASGWYYKLTSQHVFRTFWAKFGWGQVPLLGTKPYRPLALLTLAGLLGAVSFLWQRREVLKGDTLLWLGLVLLSMWGATLARGTSTLFSRNVFIPVARYALPAIIPTIVVLTAGWVELLQPARRLPRIPAWAPLVLLPALMLALDVLAVLSLVTYYG